MKIEGAEPIELNDDELNRIDRRMYVSEFLDNAEEIYDASLEDIIDAIVEYCKVTGLEIEVAATLINSNLKSKIENVALDNNMLKEKGARLPI